MSTGGRETIAARLRRRIRSLNTFFTRDLWANQPPPGRRRGVYHVLRMAVLIWEGVVKNEIFLLSAALTYKVTFALVPLLAVMLALFKGLGGMAGLGTDVREFLVQYLAPGFGDQLAGYINRTVDTLNAAALGILGVSVLLYTNYSLLHTIELAFNKIWGIKTPRRFIRRFIVYWTLLTVTPVVIGASLAASTFVQNHALYGWLAGHIPFFQKGVLFAVPILFAWAMFTLFYLIMPNTRVNLRAALFGALVAGLTWEGTKSVYVWYNSTVAATSFYGSLAAIPVFLLWIYLSWIVVLFGAELSFAVQNAARYRREVQILQVSPADRDRIALVLCLEVVKDFEAKRPPPTDEDIADRINAPVRIVHELSFQLVNKDMLRHAVSGDEGDPGLMPGADPATLTARDILHAVRTYGDRCDLPAGKEAIYGLLDRAEASATKVLAARTLKELAAEDPPPPGTKTGGAPGQEEA